VKKKKENVGGGEEELHCFGKLRVWRVGCICNESRGGGSRMSGKRGSQGESVRGEKLQGM